MSWAVTGRCRRNTEGHLLPVLSSDSLDSASFDTELFSEIFCRKRAHDQVDFFSSPPTVRAALHTRTTSLSEMTVPITCSAASFTGYRDRCILVVVLMPLGTVRDNCPLASYVFSSGHCFKMSWIRAVANSTEMIDLQTIRNRSNVFLVHHAMHIEHATTLSWPAFHSDDAVSAPVRSAGPEPAIIWCGSSHEPITSTLESVGVSLFPCISRHRCTIPIGGDAT